MKRLTPLLLFILLPACTANAQSPAVYKHELRHDPNFSIHSVTIDMTDPRVSVHVARAGEDPDGSGPWLTTLLPVPEIAERDHLDIAINGDFFSALNTKDTEGRNTGYIRGKWAGPVGWAVTDGKLWAKPATTRPAFLLDSRSHGIFENVDPKKPFPTSIRQAIGGNVLLVKNGAAVPRKETARAPRTVLGLDKTGTKLILMVVDGRQPSVSIGMTYSELADEMVKLGAYTALNLDGGGSTTLVMRNPDGKLRVINHPSDGKPRSVADVLGITVRGGVRSTN
jgi:exopolysaccharide biosynthesis protein